MGFFGGLLGSALGSIGSRFLPIPGIEGGKLGSAIGSLAPFAKGGRILRAPGMKRGGMVNKPPKKAKKGKKTK